MRNKKQSVGVVPSFAFYALCCAPGPALQDRAER